MPSMLRERMVDAMYEEPDFEHEPPEEEDIEGQDGVIFNDNFYPFYIDGERNPALTWKLHTANAERTWTVVPELRNG